MAGRAPDPGCRRRVTCRATTSPEMAAPEVTERFCAEIGGGYAFAVLNFANPDMVDTPTIPAVIKAVETVDNCLGKIVEAVDNLGGTCLITADHGNAGAYWSRTASARTRLTRRIPSPWS